eukprot:2163974-Rhodomonas_salina.2
MRRERESERARKIHHQCNSQEWRNCHHNGVRPALFLFCSRHQGERSDPDEEEEGEEEEGEAPHGEEDSPVDTVTFPFGPFFGTRRFRRIFPYFDEIEAKKY